MQAIKFNWTCPHCDHALVVTGDNYRHGLVKLEASPSKKYRCLCDMLIEVIDCPNDDCQLSTITFCINTTAYGHRPEGMIARPKSSADFQRTWTLVPSSRAKHYPDYVPKAVRDDYTEACQVCAISPKASATLARRCLQGMIRDFHGVTKSRLAEEINAMRDNVESDVWDAIDALRHMGNIGAHMEQDVNVILSVEPEEADALIQLIEMLIEEWYVARHTRSEKLKQVKELADSKKAAKSGGEKGP